MMVVQTVNAALGREVLNVLNETKPLALLEAESRIQSFCTPVFPDLLLIKAIQSFVKKTMFS